MAERDCMYNSGVICSTPVCAGCGWNPSVIAERKLMIKYEGFEKAPNGLHGLKITKSRSNHQET